MNELQNCVNVWFWLKNTQTHKCLHMGNICMPFNSEKKTSLVEDVHLNIFPEMRLIKHGFRLFSRKQRGETKKKQKKEKKRKSVEDIQFFKNKIDYSFDINL